MEKKATRMTPARPRRTAGFTLAEIILVVAVVSILVSLSTPPIIEFMKRRDIQNEQNMQNDVVKAIKAYLADRNTLPLDTDTTWSNQLAAYTNISAAQIANDAWGNPRKYVMYQLNTTFLGTNVAVYYVTLHSMGPDRKASGGAATAGGAPISNSGIAVNGTAFDVTTSGNWWKGKSDDSSRINSFVAAQPADDDMMVRMTDYPEKIERYKTSLDRMQKIAEALESYSKTKYNERVVYCTTTSPTPAECATYQSEKLIYYPRSADASGNPSTYYPTSVESDLTTYNSGSAIYNVDTNDTTRRTNMINLMRILGLPDEYCCNAMEVITGTKNEMPFYYFSNPRPRTGTGTCGTRPNPQSATPAQARTLPARLTIQGNAANASICG